MQINRTRVAIQTVEQSDIHSEETLTIDLFNTGNARMRIGDVFRHES